jgi:hypothetical protein
MFSSGYCGVEIMVACCVVVDEKLDSLDAVGRAVVAYSQRGKDRMKCDKALAASKVTFKKVPRQLWVVKENDQNVLS